MLKNTTQTPAAEGAVKISVMNQSRLVDVMRGGEWVTMKTHAGEAGLPKGTYRLDTARQASKNVHPHAYTGPVVHADRSSVYQLDGAGVVRHDRALFQAEPVVGQCYKLEYRRGVGQLVGEVTPEQAMKAQQARGRSI